MAYNVSAAFREQCYSGESLYSCRLIIGENTIPISQIASITISSPIIDSNSETFYIGTFISQQLTIEFKNLDGIDTASGTNVELYISQNVGGTDIEVPIGKYVIDESPENYYQSAKIVCLDYAIKFATNLDYSSALVDNKITIDNLLQWICNHYGVTLGSYPSINGNVEIGTYDSTVSGKRWISYIAEIKGCNAKMDRLGQLTLVPIKSSPAVTINALKSASWELGEKFEISQVTFFDAIRNYTYGDDSENTLFLRQDNPFIIDTNVVQNVYNAVKDLQIWSLKCDNYGDISLDAWDIIQYTLGNETYYTYNNNTITYAMTIMSKVDTKIPTKQQEVTTNVLGGNEEVQIRRLKTEVNSIENTITLQAEQIETIEEELASPTSTKEGKYFDLEDALDSPLIDFSLYGETQQDSTTGKNLYDVGTLTTKTDAGITFTPVYKNGLLQYINANGTATANVFYNFNLLTFQAGTYIITGCTGGASGTYYIGVNFGLGRMQQKNDPVTFTLSTERTMNESFIRIANGTQLNNVKFYPMIRPSSITDDTYEPYTNGPAPSPLYPFDIHNVSGDNTIEICGKNLIDLSNMLIAGGWTDTTFVPTSSNYITLQYIRVRPSTKYTLSTNLSSTKYNAIRVVDFNSNKNIIRRNAAINLSTLNTFTTSNDTYYIAICFYTGQTATTSDLTQAQLELGETSSEYEAYQGNSQLISLGVENLVDTIAYNKTANSSGVISIPQSPQLYLSINDYVPLKPNTTYTITFEKDDGGKLFVSKKDQNGTFIERKDYGSARTFTTEDNVYQGFIYIYKSGGNYTEGGWVQLEKGSKANSYSEYGKPYIELNKISTYQDYIYKDNDRWYLHKEIGKMIFNGSESWSLAISGTNTNLYWSQLTYISADVLSNYFTRNDNLYNEDVEGMRGVTSNNRMWFRISNTTASDSTAFKTWLSTHNTIVYYVLATPTNTEITDTTLLEQLNNLMTLPLYKNMTHITLTPNDLQPTMKIEYYRDTSINANFVPKEDMTKYYTKTETNSQIQISSSGIMSEVSRVDSRVDEEHKYALSVESTASTALSNSKLALEFKTEVDENGVKKVKTTTGFTFDEQGLSITKGENFSTQMTDRSFEVSDGTKELIYMGYDNSKKTTVARMDWLESEHATIGVHRTEIITKNGKKRTAGFYVGGDN